MGSPAAFFANEHKYKYEEGYDTVRFVPDSVLEILGVKDGQEVHVQLVAKERCPPRAWNGDTFDGWTLTLGKTHGKMWREILSSNVFAKVLEIPRGRSK